MAVSTQEIANANELVDLYRLAHQLSSAEQADKIALEEVLELGKTALGKSVRVRALEGVRSIVRFNRLTRAGRLDTTHSHPSSYFVSDGRYYGRADFDILPPWHRVFPQSTEGNITEADLEKPYMVLKPKRALTDEFSDRFKIKMIDEEGVPLVDLEFLSEN